MLSIAGKDKVEVFRRLYNAARTGQTHLVTVKGEKGEPKKVPVPKALDLKQATSLLKLYKDPQGNLPPLIGRVGDRELHIDLRGEEFDETQYDNRNGWGTAEKALQDL